MSRQVMVLIALGITAAALPGQAATLDVRTGLWEMTSMVDGPETTGGASKPDVTRSCITDQTLQRGMHFSPGKRGNCTRTLLHSSPRQIELRMECTGKDNAVGTFSMQASDPQTMKGKLDLVVNNGPNPTTIKRTLRGTWLGSDCGRVKPQE